MASYTRAFLTEKFALELPASFTIDALHTHLEEWNQAIPSWKLTGKLNLKSFDIDDYSLRDTAIEFSQKDTIYKILLNGKINSAHIQATANGSWTTPSTDEWWSDTNLQYTLKASQLTSPCQSMAFPKFKESISNLLASTSKVPSSSRIPNSIKLR